MTTNKFAQNSQMLQNIFSFAVLEATDNRRQEHQLFLAGKNGKLTSRHIRFKKQSASLHCQLFLVRITTKSGHGPFIAVYSLKVLLYPLFRMTLRWEGFGRGGGGAGKEDRKAKGRREGGVWVQLWWKHWKQVWNSLLHTANTGDCKNLF